MNKTQIGSSNQTDKQQVTVSLDRETVEMYLELKSLASTLGESYSLTSEIVRMIHKTHSERLGELANADADARFFGKVNVMSAAC